jgi:hypothetical protein
MKRTPIFFASSGPDLQALFSGASFISSFLKEGALVIRCKAREAAAKTLSIEMINQQKAFIMNRRSKYLTPTLSAVLLAFSHLVHGQNYTLQQILPPAGTASCAPEALNNLGQVVGNTSIQVGSGRKASYVPGPAFFWDNGNSFNLSPIAGRQCADAHRVSDTSLAIGISYNIVNGIMSDPRPTRWIGDFNGSFTPIDCTPLLPVGYNWEPWAISEDGRFICFESDTQNVMLEFD